MDFLPDVTTNNLKSHTKTLKSNPLLKDPSVLDNVDPQTQRSSLENDDTPKVGTDLKGKTDLSVDACSIRQ